MYRLERNGTECKICVMKRSEKLFINVLNINRCRHTHTHTIKSVHRLNIKYTLSICWLVGFGFGKSRFHIQRWNSIILNFNVELFDVQFLTTSLELHSWQFLFIPTYRSHSDIMNCSVHKINTDVHFICELQATGKLYRAACSLSDFDSHFLPNQTNSCSCSFLNVCNNTQQYIRT
jgi:hypothetical protein